MNGIVWRKEALAQPPKTLPATKPRWSRLARLPDPGQKPDGLRSRAPYLAGAAARRHGRRRATLSPHLPALFRRLAASPGEWVAAGSPPAQRKASAACYGVAPAPSCPETDPPLGCNPQGGETASSSPAQTVGLGFRCRQFASKELDGFPVRGPR